MDNTAAVQQVYTLQAELDNVAAVLKSYAAERNKHAGLYCRASGYLMGCKRLNRGTDKGARRGRDSVQGQIAETKER